ncbi:MAG: ABC transporter ATP-binding protein [Thermoplasmata archaeon]
MEPVIEIRKLRKKYGGLVAVNNISITIHRGEIFAFVGPNGAGKTTTVEICEGIRSPTSGTVRLFGEKFSRSSKNIRERIGVLPQEYRSLERLTVKETLKYYASFYKRNRDIDDIISLMELEDKRDELYMNLSGGLKQRVGVAMALVNDPDLIFLDEPTTGLDPRARRGVWKAIKSLKKEGKTIFLTTHYMEEAEYLADRVAIIHHGNIVAKGSTHGLISRYGDGYTVKLHGSDTSGMKINGKSSSNGTLSFKVEHIQEISRILEEATRAGTKLESMEVRRANLEEVFLNLTGTTLEGGDEA